MDTSFTIKPRPGVGPRAHSPRDPVAVRETVDTELDPAKVVAAADSGARQNNNGPQNHRPQDHRPQDHGTQIHGPQIHQPHDEASAREVVIDPKGQEVLFGAVDVRAEHADQSPNQALMGLRTYQQHQVPTESPKPTQDDPHADIEV
jgi:hypothetical protein